MDRPAIIRKTAFDLRVAPNLAVYDAECSTPPQNLQLKAEHHPRDADSLQREFHGTPPLLIASYLCNLHLLI